MLTTRLSPANGYRSAKATTCPPAARASSRSPTSGIVVWRDSIGTAHVWRDYCPHRGAQLSLGQVTGDLIVCPYHAGDTTFEGQCLHISSNRRCVRRSARA